MPKKFRAQLVTPQGVKFEGEVEYLRLPAEDGYFGIMAEHAPLIAALAPGEVTVTLDNVQPPLRFAGSGGVVEVSDNHAVVLADTLETAEEIDAARAQEAADRARQRLMHPGSELNVDRAQAALDRALARLRVALSGR